MRALVVAPQPFFTPRGTPLSVYYRLLVLAEQGVEIDLLTYGDGRDVSIPGLRIHRISHWPFSAAVRVGPSALKAFLDVRLFLKTVARLFRNRYDFICAHEEAAFFCVFLKPVFGFPFVYEMHSSLPQQLLNFAFTRSRLLIGLFRKLEGRCLTGADVVVTVSASIAEYASARMPDRRRQLLIENSMLEPVRFKGENEGSCPDVVGQGKPAYRVEALPSDRFLIVYAGTLEEYQGVDLLLASFADVRAERQEPFLVVVGGQPRQVGRYRSMAEELGIEKDCLFIGQVDQSIAREYLAQADLHVSPRCSGMNAPSKIYEQLASGTPLVATRVLAHTQVLDDQICVMVDPSAESMAAGMMTVLRNPDGAARTAERALAHFEREYGRTAYENKVRELLNLVGAARSRLPVPED